MKKVIRYMQLGYVYYYTKSVY